MEIKKKRKGTNKRRALLFYFLYHRLFQVSQTASETWLSRSKLREARALLSPVTRDTANLANFYCARRSFALEPLIFVIFFSSGKFL